MKYKEIYERIKDWGECGVVLKIGTGIYEKGKLVYRKNATPGGGKHWFILSNNGILKGTRCDGEIDNWKYSYAIWSDSNMDTGIADIQKIHVKNCTATYNGVTPENEIEIKEKEKMNVKKLKVKSLKLKAINKFTLSKVVQQICLFDKTSSTTWKEVDGKFHLIKCDDLSYGEEVTVESAGKILYDACMKNDQDVLAYVSAYGLISEITFTE